MDLKNQKKWDKASLTFDIMSSRGVEMRWKPYKEALFAKMQGEILFLALGTGLDIATFPPGKSITAIDISPKMLERALPRIEAYEGRLVARVMDVHSLEFEDNSFDQIFTSCTFCSVPNPVNGLLSLKRVLKPGGDLYMFEHTGSHIFPFNFMTNLMTVLTEKFGPAMNRDTVANVRSAGFQLIEINNLYLDVVKTIHAFKP